ncbi:MAG TPA: helix-turn-helix domain-containing protein [Gemmataceae bacterium]|jgi:hypothetical protein
MHPTEKNNSQTTKAIPPQGNDHSSSLAPAVEQPEHFGERLCRLEATIVDLTGKVDQANRQLATVAQALSELLQVRTAKDYYTTAEVAKVLGKAEYTVREWCRQGRIRGRKKACGRGKGGEWLVSHEELTRIRNEGLLPFPRPA